jgi:hypothetical protein
MKILIATPIHEIKDYCIEQWLRNVFKLQQKFPSDFLMVDNSVGLNYVEKVKRYCKKIGIKNYKIEHIEIPPLQGKEEKIGRSWEVIRQEVLSKGYDAWFSWQSDVFISPNTLNILVPIMETGNYSIINPGTWRDHAEIEPEVGFDICLIHRSALEKHGFLLTYPGSQPTWFRGDLWFRKQVLASGGSAIEVYGLIKPIHHLRK